jgi:hypothetical protein
MLNLAGGGRRGANAALAELWDDLWPLAIIGMMTLPIAAWMFRNRLT